MVTDAVFTATHLPFFFLCTVGLALPSMVVSAS